MKRLWLVRLGKSGDGEAAALETSNLVLGFTIDNLAGAKDREAVLAVVARSPTSSPRPNLTSPHATPSGLAGEYAHTAIVKNRSFASLPGIRGTRSYVARINLEQLKLHCGATG
jgi:hypothetical protein